MEITLDTLVDYPDFVLDEPGAAAPPPAGMSRLEYRVGAPLLALTLAGVPLYLLAHTVAAVGGGL